MRAKYRRSFSAGEKKISKENEVIDFYHYDISPKVNAYVQFLSFVTYGQPCRIRLNNEDTIHLVEENSEFIITDIDIDKITILDGGVEYYYTALSTMM